MRTLVLDYSWGRPDLAAARRQGYVAVMRYLANKVDAKLLQGPEVSAIHAADMAIGVVWETYAKRPAEGGPAGAADVRAAEAQADALGMPLECPIFYAVDFDTTPEVVADYFASVRAGAKRPVGVYGSFRIVDGIDADYYWQCAAWSRGKISPRAHLYQRIGHTVSPAPISTDENHLYQGFPLWGKDGVMLINPTAGRISRAFSSVKVKNPATGIYSVHLGTDVAAATGTPIKAPASGLVRAVRTDSYAGDTRPGLKPGRTGNGLIIDHDGFSTYHGHVSKVLVRAGEKVKAGQVVALVGATGAVTGPHNHTEVEVGGLAVDPVAFYAKRGAKLGIDPYSLEYVKEVQRLLNLAGAGLSVDGDLGSRTIAAVVAFQSARGLVADGDPGPKTLAALRDGAIPPAPAPVVEEDELMAVTDTIEAALAQGQEGVRSAGWVEVALAGIRAEVAALAAAVAATPAPAPAVEGADADAVAEAIIAKLTARLAA